MRRKKNSRFLICIIWCKKERERAELFFFFLREQELFLSVRRCQIDDLLCVNWIIFKYI